MPTIISLYGKFPGLPYDGETIEYLSKIFGVWLQLRHPNVARRHKTPSTVVSYKEP